MSDMKKCSKCGIEKDESEFQKNNQTRDGFGYHCKECRRLISEFKHRFPYGPKTCSKCGIEKDKSEFYINKKLNDCRNSWCKGCCRKANRQWREQNKVHLNKMSQEKYIKNKKLNYEIIKEYRIKNNAQIKDKRVMQNEKLKKLKELDEIDTIDAGIKEKWAKSGKLKVVL
jgi:hypothetical protein